MDRSKAISFREMLRETGGEEDHLPAFLESYDSRSVYNLVVKHTERERSSILIVSPGDSLELDDFVQKVADRLHTGTVHMVRPEDGTILWEGKDVDACANSTRGVVIRNASGLSEQMRREANRLCQATHGRRFLLPIFPTKESCEQQRSKWPRAMRNRFHEKCLTWPEPSRRVKDMKAMTKWALKRIEKALQVDELHLMKEVERFFVDEPAKDVETHLNRLLCAALNARGHNSDWLTLDDFVHDTAPATTATAAALAL